MADLCIGYNSLHNTEAKVKDPTAPDGPLPKMPYGTRLWTWLILCSDGKRMRCNLNLVRAEMKC